MKRATGTQESTPSAEEGEKGGTSPGNASPDAGRDAADSEDPAHADGRGRRAGMPTAIPLEGWWDIVRRVSAQVVEQNVVVLSAGIAFFAMLALFPTLGAIVTLYALIADPTDVAEHFTALSTILPDDVASIIDRRLRTLTERQQGLGLGLTFGLLFAIWSARRGVDALVRAVTVAYGEQETRGLIHMTAVTGLLTVGTIMLLVTTIALRVALPAVLSWLPLSGALSFAVNAGGWLLFFAVVMFALGVLYRHGPPRRSARVRWLSPGAVVGTTLWLLGSAGFSLYVQNFGAFNEIYGTLGAIIVLLLWFFMSAFSILLGALLNAEMEHQTARDTTVGTKRPMGERGAFVADTVGEKP